MRPSIFFLFLALPISVLAQSDEELCKEFTQFEQDINKKLPMKVDEVTTVIQIKINCETKTQVFTKQLSIAKEDLAKGWELRKQRQHSQLHCNKNGMASNFKWTVIDNIFDQDFNLIGILKTKPLDCN